jgi:hypothetical protein
MNLALPHQVDSTGFLRLFSYVSAHIRYFPKEEKERVLVQLGQTNESWEQMREQAQQLILDAMNKSEQQVMELVGSTLEITNKVLREKEATVEQLPLQELEFPGQLPNKEGKVVPQLEDKTMVENSAMLPPPSDGVVVAAVPTPQSGFSMGQALGKPAPPSAPEIPLPSSNSPGGFASHQASVPDSGSSFSPSLQNQPSYQNPIESYTIPNENGLPEQPQSSWQQPPTAPGSGSSAYQTPPLEPTIESEVWSVREPNIGNNAYNTPNYNQSSPSHANAESWVVPSTAAPSSNSHSQAHSNYSSQLSAPQNPSYNSPHSPPTEPRLSMHQYASLRADMAIASPDRYAAIQSSYGLDAHSDAQEEALWTSRFSANQALFRNYMELFQYFRALKSKNG